MAAARVKVTVAFQQRPDAAIVRRKKVLSLKPEASLEWIYETVAGRFGGPALWPKDYGESLGSDTVGTELLFLQVDPPTDGCPEPTPVWKCAPSHATLADMVRHCPDGPTADLLLRIVPIPPHAAEADAKVAGTVFYSRTFLHVKAKNGGDSLDLTPRALSDPTSSQRSTPGSGLSRQPSCGGLVEQAEEDKEQRYRCDQYIRQNLQRHLVRSNGAVTDVFGEDSSAIHGPQSEPTPSSTVPMPGGARLFNLDLEPDRKTSLRQDCPIHSPFVHCPNSRAEVAESDSPDLWESSDSQRRTKTAQGVWSATHPWHVDLPEQQISVDSSQASSNPHPQQVPRQVPSRGHPPLAPIGPRPGNQAESSKPTRGSAWHNAPLNSLPCFPDMIPAQSPVAKRPGDPFGQPYPNSSKDEPSMQRLSHPFENQLQPPTPFSHVAYLNEDTTSPKQLPYTDAPTRPGNFPVGAPFAAGRYLSDNGIENPANGDFGCAILAVSCATQPPQPPLQNVVPSIWLPRQPQTRGNQSCGPSAAQIWASQLEDIPANDKPAPVVEVIEEAGGSPSDSDEREKREESAITLAAPRAEELFDIVSRNDIPALKTIIDSKADLNECTAKGSQVLFRAVIKARKVLPIQLLLESSASALAADPQGNQVMHFWARATVGRNDLLEMGKSLISFAADVNAQRYKDNMTPLHHVVVGHNNRRGWLDFHKALMLVRNGADIRRRTHIGQLPVSLIVTDRRVATQKMRYLLQHGIQDGAWPTCEHQCCPWCH